MTPWCCAVVITQHYVGCHGAGSFMAGLDSAFSETDWFCPPAKSGDK